MRKCSSAFFEIQLSGTVTTEYWNDEELTMSIANQQQAPEQISATHSHVLHQA